MQSDKLTNQFWLEKKLGYRFFCWTIFLFTNLLITFWNYWYVKSMFSPPSEYLIFFHIFILLGSIRSPLWISLFAGNVTIHPPGEGQNLERRNAERPIFRNFKIANIKITKDKLFDNFIFEINFSFFINNLNTENKYLIIKLWNIDFPNGRNTFFLFSKLLNFTKFLIIANNSIIILSINYLGNWLHFRIRNF